MSENHTIKGEIVANNNRKRNQQKQTRKLLKVLQEEIFWNQNENGEWIGQKYNVVDFMEKDANFHKIWLFVMLDMLGLIGNSKIKVASYLLDKRDSNNCVFENIREIAKNCNVSVDTAFKTLKILKDNGLLIQFGRGSVYQISPKLIFKGYSNKRLGLILNFNNQLEKNSKNKNEIKEQQLPPFKDNSSLMDKIKNDIKKHKNNIENLQFKLKALNINNFDDDFDYDSTKQSLEYEIDDEKIKLNNAFHALDYLKNCE